MLGDEEGGTMRKEGRGGRRDEEIEKMKNKKVAKGRIIGLAGPCSFPPRLSRLLSNLVGRLVPAVSSRAH